MHPMHAFVCVGLRSAGDCPHECQHKQTGVLYLYLPLKGPARHCDNRTIPVGTDLQKLIRSAAVQTASSQHLDHSVGIIRIHIHNLWTKLAHVLKIRAYE